MSDFTKKELAAQERLRLRQNVEADPPPPPAPEEEAPAMQMVEHDHLAEPEPEPPPQPEPATPFEAYLAALPDDIREIMDVDELAKEFAKAEAEAKEEARRVAREKARARAKKLARASAGLQTQTEIEAERLAERNNRMVRITPQMPFVGDTGGTSAACVELDNVKYVHGQTYTVPYARALVIRDILFRLHQHELDFEGKGRLNGLRREHASKINLVDLRQ